MHHLLGAMQNPDAERGHQLSHVELQIEKDLKVVVGEERGPSGLPPIQCTTDGEVNYIFVVGRHLDAMLGPSQTGSLFGKGRDDCCKLLVVDRIIDFRGGKLPRVEGNRIEMEGVESTLRRRCPKKWSILSSKDD